MRENSFSIKPHTILFTVLHTLFMELLQVQSSTLDEYHVPWTMQKHYSHVMHTRMNRKRKKHILPGMEDQQTLNSFRGIGLNKLYYQLE